MSDFYCSGCSKWARSPHYCPGRQIEGKEQYVASNSASAQIEKLMRRKAELERELNEINARLGGVQ